MGFRQVVESFRRSETGRALIPMGVGLGLPVPYLAGGRVYVLMPLLERMKETAESDRVPVRKPVGELRFDAKAGNLVGFRLYRCDDPMPDVSWDRPFTWFPPRIVIERQWTREAFIEKQNELHDKLDRLAASLAPGQQPESGAVNEFQMLFFKLCEPEMHDYYHAVVGGTLLVSVAPPGGRNSKSAPLTPFD